MTWRAVMDSVGDRDREPSAGTARAWNCDSVTQMA